MLKRKIYDELLAWKKAKRKECLLVKGSRQCGKTYIIEQFGKENYSNFFSLNFILSPQLKTIFSGSLLADDLVMKISMFFPGAKFIAGDTLIFLDEIQACPNARTALKSFALDGRFDVIASGSLLGLHYGQDPELEEEIPSVPVGYERQIFMYPLDFEEFLWAKGYIGEQIAMLKSYFEREEKVPSDVNEQMLGLFRQYIVVGGMPAVVSAFIETSNMSEVQAEQEKILASYADDIARHARGSEKQKVHKCWNSIPRQLAKENRKFQYSKVEHGGSGRKFTGSIQWLEDASVVNICSNVSVPKFPLSIYADDDYFKIYMNDTGLLSAMAGFDVKAGIMNKTLEGDLKGGIYENAVAQILKAKGYELYYYRPAENNDEIEFLISKDGNVYPVGVKARRGGTVSMNRYISKFHPVTAYKLIDGNVGREGEKLTIPHYFAAFL